MENQIKINKWIHPTTGEVRLYVSTTLFKPWENQLYFVVSSKGEVFPKVKSQKDGFVNYKYRGIDGAFQMVEDVFGKINAEELNLKLGVN